MLAKRELVAQERAKRPVIPCEVQAIRIGDLGIVTNGAEFFCQLGLDIKAASPFARTWVVSLANGWIGYVPTASAYYAGGYEPRTARSAKMAAWAGQSLVEASLGRLNEFIKRRGKQIWFETHFRGAKGDNVLTRFAERGAYRSRRKVDSRLVAAHPVLGGFFGSARVGQGVASQLGIVAGRGSHFLDPFLNDLRRLADRGGAPDHAVSERLHEDDGVVVERVVGALLAELLNVVGELLVEPGGGFVEELAELDEVFCRRAWLERRDLAHRLQVVDEFGRSLLRQEMGERPCFGVIGRRERGLEQERLGWGRWRLAGDFLGGVADVFTGSRAGLRARESSPCATS